VEFSVEFLNKIAIHIINYTVHQNLLFPDGVNVNLFKIVDGRNISLLTYERGCGFTVACGSGACATAYYTITQHLTSDRVTVHMQKGVLELELTDKLISYGQAHKVFDGEYYHE
jgi:diaminopimelate epimerase